MPFEYEAGDKAAVDAAFAKAAHVTKLRMESTRVVPSPMEPRACLVAFDPQERQLHGPCLRAGREHDEAPARRVHASSLKTSSASSRATSAAVSASAAPRTASTCAVMIAAKATGKPVKWVSSRTEAFLSDTHGRGNMIDGELALDKDGRFLAHQGRLDRRHGRVSHARRAGEPHPQPGDLPDRRLQDPRAIRATGVSR